jgi:DeoR/GlpR family transcriptional regulator of sugar metabolism
MNSDINIITVDKDDIRFHNFCDRIEEFASSLPNNMKRINNYRQDLKIRESIAVSVFEQDSNILGFSSILHRKMFSNGVRIINRLVKKIDYRFQNNKGNITDETKIMIDQQLEIARKYHFDYAFISRESNKPVSSLKHYFREFPEWVCPLEKFYVCKNGQSCGQSCKQYVVWLPLKNNIKFPLRPVPITNTKEQ